MTSAFGPLRTFVRSSVRSMLFTSLLACSPSKGGLGLAAALMFGGRRCAPTPLRCSVPRPHRVTRFVRFALYAQTPAMSQFTTALRAGPRALRFSAPLVRAASKPSPPLRQQCLRATVARRHGAGLRQSGGPRSEVKGENWAQPSSEDMSGGGHPADVARGQRQHAEGSEKNFRNRREPNVRNGPQAAIRRHEATP